MKNPYFKPDAIENEARRLIKEVEPYSRQDAVSFQCNASALLILDMQRYFLESDSHAFVPCGPVILRNILMLKKVFAQSGSPVILTRHVNTDANAGMMRHRWKDLLNAQDERSEIVQPLQDAGNYTIFKSQYDAFYETHLQDMLDMHQVTQVVVTGVMTHLCVESTARSAFMHGYTVYLPADATATYNREYHRASLLNLGHGFANLCLTRDLLSAFGAET